MRLLFWTRGEVLGTKGFWVCQSSLDVLHLNSTGCDKDTREVTLCWTKWGFQYQEGIIESFFTFLNPWRLPSSWKKSQESPFSCSA